ncbi:hypothetical protein [Hydrogenophaga sp.]|uniref:hypothetical protein n=1 Tax=Hydrogenophaga sp. TaxID=1904254 RepID=UPI002717786C|nr:hypothetical protein [Hydrogenophaga sp.]MDO8904888.1 hypothetical protein [Hydrogenophaga sp.]
MQSSYAERFEREMGCTEAEWLGWLPAAMGDVVWQQKGQGLGAELPPGSLSIAWQPRPPRVIALMRMPVLHVRFTFSGLDEGQRYTFMRRFDLYMQRGGG